MATSSVFRRSAAAAAMLVAVFGVAANAQAGGLEAGKCYSKAAAEAVLAQEGQKPIFGGDRIADSKPANIFFVNDSGYGYNIEGDQSLGIPSQKLCARAAYKNVHINSRDNPEIPSWGQNIKNNGGIDVHKAYQTGGRLVFAAQSYSVKGGKEVDGQAITVMAGSTESGRTDAAVWSVSSAGVPDDLFSMVKFSVFPHMNTLIAQAQAQRNASLSNGTAVAMAPR